MTVIGNLVCVVVNGKYLFLIFFILLYYIDSLPNKPIILTNSIGGIFCLILFIMKSFQFCLLCTRTIFKSTHTISKPRYTPTSFTKLFYARKLTEPSNTKKKKKTKVEIPVSTTDEDISKHFEM